MTPYEERCRAIVLAVHGLGYDASPVPRVIAYASVESGGSIDIDITDLLPPRTYRAVRARILSAVAEFDAQQEQQAAEAKANGWLPRVAPVRPNWLYVMRCGDHHKIGISRNVDARHGQISKGTPLPVAVVARWQFEGGDAANMEAHWHNRYADKRVRGEWFDLDAADLEEMAATMGGGA